MSLHAHNQALS
jgi:hypothetical protein